MTLDEFFAKYEKTRQLYDALYYVVESIGPVTVRVTKSQVAFRRKRTFAWAWIPAQYLRGKTAPLVLTVSLQSRDQSPRWKEIVEPRPGRFTHHLELYRTTEIDDEVRDWLRESWQNAG